ncbi:LOW QUALITY PROTEIN: reverse transcriptase, partial [Phytophthora megakarya]
MVTLNRLDEILNPKTDNPVVRVAAVTTRAGRAADEILNPKTDNPVVRVAAVTTRAGWAGSTLLLPSHAKIGRRTRPINEIGSPRNATVGRFTPLSHHRIKDHFHWRGLYRSVQGYVGECVDCETGKGKPVIRGESPGNLQVMYPFQIIAMDRIPSLPRSHKGNTELLIWVDLFTGYVIAKASSSRSAQTVAESYKECVFRRFGDSEMIRHDREPGFMSDFF